MASSDDLPDLITDLVTKWEDSIEIGLNLTPKEICFEHPELEDVVTAQIWKLKRMRWLTTTWDSHASETLANGTLVTNRFRIEGVLGSGGFGTVYRAMDLELLRFVALKIANPNRSDPDTLLTEARKAASLHHPHVITVYDVGRFEERVFVVSQLVEGRSLKEVAFGSKLATSQVAQWMTQVAQALALAHQNGLIHRDLKPSNIIINSDRQAMVSDFGIAFHADEIDQIEPLTGTLPYMSPEQVQGELKLMGPKSDIYALGVMLYELLAGKHPFLGKSPAETIRKITTGIPEPFANVPIQLKRLCEQCLSSRPEDRPTAAQIVATLKDFVESGQSRTSLFSALTPWLAGLLFATGLAAVALWPFYPAVPEQELVTQTGSVGMPKFEEESPPADVSQEPSIAVAPVEETDQVAAAATAKPGRIDLLEQIDPRRQTIRGLWTKVDDVLSVVSPKGVNEPTGAALHIDYRPQGAYRLTVRARRSSNGGIIVPVVFSGRQFGVYLSGGWSGSKIPEARPMIQYDVDFFPTTDWHTVKVDVDRQRVRCVGDSGAELEWEADYASLEGRPFDMPDASSLYLKVWGEFEIDTLTIEEHE